MQALSRYFCCLQILYTMVAMVVSLTVFAYLLGEISNLVMDQDAELVKIRSQVRVAVQQQATCLWAAWRDPHKLGHHGLFALGSACCCCS